MSEHVSNLEAIAGMALATLACRFGGYWLFARITPTPFIRHMLSYLPGTIFMAFVTPALIRGGPQDWVGAACAIAAMMFIRNLGAAIGLGVAGAWAWHLLA
jgi:uncharacterized membrane protein